MSDDKKNSIIQGQLFDKDGKVYHKNDKKTPVKNFDWTVQNRIKDILQEEGREQAWLSENTNIDRSTISQIINCKIQPSMSNAFKIAYVLDKPLNEVFYVSSQRVWSDMIEYDQNNCEEEFLNKIELVIKGRKIPLDEVVMIFENIGKLESLNVSFENIAQINNNNEAFATKVANIILEKLRKEKQ